MAPCRSHDPNLTAEHLVGGYERQPVGNDWHRVTVALEAGALRWQNAAAVAWDLHLMQGALRTGEDCPYGAQALRVDTTGAGQDLSVTGLWFNGELYTRVR